MTPEDTALMLSLALAECRRLRAALDAEQRAHCATLDALAVDTFARSVRARADAVRAKIATLDEELSR